MPRREQILAAALREFGDKGLYGGSTVTIAKAAGGSHPGLFRTFPTKKELFVAVLERAFATIEQELVAAEEAAKDDRLQAAAMVWSALVGKRELMLILIQGYAASEDPDIRDLMRGWTRGFFERMESVSRVEAGPVHQFFATGMLYMVASCMDLPARAEGDAWASRFLTSGSRPPFPDP